MVLQNVQPSRINLLSVLSVIILLNGCSILKPFGIGGDENGNGHDVTQPLYDENQGTQPPAQTAAVQPRGARRQGQQQAYTPPSRTGPGVVTQRTGDQRSADVQISEMRFELKKLQAEIAHLNTEITNLNNRSEMWRNPQEIYNKRIILTNGTTFNGNVVYQDELVVKVETLIGSLVLQRDSITRIVESVPQIMVEDMRAPTPLSRQPGVIKETAGGYANAATGGIKRANVVLDGTIKEKKDKSGNTIFSGVIKNTGNRRADFVKVNFIVRKDWSGTTQTFTTFVNGAQYTYASGVTTDTTLPPGANGVFELYVPRTIGPFIGYSYSLDWEEYE